VPVDDLHRFRIDPSCSSTTQHYILGFVQPDCPAVLQLLLACAPLFDVMTNDVYINGIAVQRATIVL
jgi:hypothetical protein